jgi:hypothetical protein
LRKLFILITNLIFVLSVSSAYAQGTTDATGTDKKEPKKEVVKPVVPVTPVTPVTPVEPKLPDDPEKPAVFVDEKVKTEKKENNKMVLPAFVSSESNFVDTRISFIFGDDDFFHKAGESIVDSPLLGFGNRPGYELFFDNLNSSRTGRENQLHLVLYKKLAGYIPGIVTEGAIVALYDFTSSRDGEFKDDGTYMKITKNISDKSDFSLTMFPVSTNRFRLGYLYDLTWAGSSAFPGAHGNLTPGIKFAYKDEGKYGFLGFKTARILTNPPPGSDIGREKETFYSVLGGFGIQPNKSFNFEANGGFIQMGENPNSGVEGEVVQLFGGSARITYLKDMKIPMSADLRLYRNDPQFIAQIMRKPSYKPGFAYRFSAEGNIIYQTLEDPDNYATTKLQLAYAGALSANFRKDYLRGNFTIFSRSVSFILMNVPSYVPYQAFSGELETTPEIFAAAGLDYYLPKWHLTLGGAIGLQMPASAQVDLTASTGASEIDLGRRTLVIRNEGDVSVLPEGEETMPIFGAKFTAKFDLSKMMSVSLMILIQNDPNYTTLKTLPNGTAKREFEDAFKFGAAIVTSAKF